MQTTDNLGLKLPEGNEWADIDTINENMEKLDGAFTTLPMTAVSAGSTEEEINSFYDNYSAGMENDTSYKILVENQFQHPILGGGTFLFEGVKHETAYEYQTLKSYSPPAENVLRYFTRYKYAGTWLLWKAVDIGNVLTANKSVYVDATNGDDTTGDGTQSKPWATIQKAVDECPNMGATTTITYVIYLAPGTYDEAINILKHTKINIYGATTDVLNDADAYKVKSITTFVNTTCNIQGIYFYGNDAETTKIGCNVAGNAYIRRCKFDDCICKSIERNSVIEIKGCDFSNYRSGTVTYGAITGDRGTIVCSVISGSNNKCGYSTKNSDSGARIYVNDSANFTADVMYAEGFNSRIEVGTSGWQTIGSVTGANTVAIDSDLYTEFLVCVKYNNLEVTINIPSQQLGTAVCGGYYESNGKGMKVHLNTSASVIQMPLNSVYYYTSDVTSTATMTVYGRRV